MGWGRWGVVRVRCACGGLVPLPAPSRNRGSAPDPAPQAPEGLGSGAPFRGCGGSAPTAVPQIRSSTLASRDPIRVAESRPA
ncbi:hypothetical protein GT035_18015 [Streptomyces sp. SID4913]|nr:hypothetical protein [Streptomyces sp. SID4913]